MKPKGGWGEEEWNSNNQQDERNYLQIEPSEPEEKATDSFSKQQSRSAASEGTSTLSLPLSTSCNRSVCKHHLNFSKLYTKKEKKLSNGQMITESHEEIRRLLVQGANRIRETASIIGLLVKFKEV